MHKYTRIKVLGKGGFGEAVLVEDKSTKKKFVIKEARACMLGGLRSLPLRPDRLSLVNHAVHIRVLFQAILFAVLD